jgi:predicted RNA-binding Zn-ribbon protein involved in translation (DUF1610 family)
MTRLRCSKCGAEMNRHAEKIVHPAGAEELRLVDAAAGGLLEETHACPNCGNVESRRV